MGTPQTSTMSLWKTWLRSWSRPRRRSPMSNRDDESTRKSQDREQDRKRVKVLLVDDHTMFRQGLSGMLSSSSYGEEEVEVVGKTPLGEEAVEVAREENPDVLIMQVDRTLQKAKNILEQIRQGSSSPPNVIILTVFEDARTLREVLELGVEAYVHKSASVEELLATLHRATTTTLDGQREPMIVSLP